MIINDNSILNRLPADKIPERELYYFEAITTFFRVIGKHYDRIFELLSSEPISTDEGIVMEIWGVIDSFRKLDSILNQFPGLKKKDPAIQVFLRKLRATEELRHFIQHYNQEIDNLVENLQPPLGYVSFVKNLGDGKLQSAVIVPMVLRKYQGLKIVNPLGMNIRLTIDLITYYFGDHEIDLSVLLYGSQDFVLEIERIVEDKY